MLVVNLRKWPKIETEADAMASLFWHTLDSLAPVLMLNNRGALSYANGHFGQVSGYELDEIPGFFEELVFFGKHPEGFNAELRDLIQSNHSWVNTIFLRNKYGLPEEFEAHFIPRDPYSSDAENCLILVPSWWNKASEKAENPDSFQSLRESAYDIYDELKKLGSLIKDLESIDLEAEQRDLVVKIEKHHRSLTEKIDEHFKKAAKAWDKVHDLPGLFDLKEILQNTLAKFQTTATQKGIQVIAEVEHPLQEKVLGNKALLEQAVESALEFLIQRCDTKIINLTSLSVFPNESTCEVSVFILGLFDENQASSEPSRKVLHADMFDAEGLNDRLHKSGGKVLMHQLTGQSFCLHFTMPFQLHVPVSDFQAEETTLGDESFPENTLVLIAEDDELNQMVMNQHLLKMGLNPHFVRTGFSVLENIRIHSYDLIIMDTQMPGLGGEQTIKAIRQKKNLLYSEIPIIGTSASFADHVRHSCLKAGADDFVTKPYEPSELRQKMVRLVKQYRIKKLKKPGHLLPTDFLPVMEKYFDLKYLEETSEGDKEFASTMISFFVENTPSVLENLKNRLQAEDWEAVRQIAHKLKPQVIYMGIHIIKDDVEKMEHYANLRTNLSEIPDLALKTEKYCFLAIEQLKDELKSYEMG